MVSYCPHRAAPVPSNNSQAAGTNMLKCYSSLQNWQQASISQEFMLLWGLSSHICHKGPIVLNCLGGLAIQQPTAQVKSQDNPHTIRRRRCVLEGYSSGKTELGTGLEHQDPESISSAMSSYQAKHKENRATSHSSQWLATCTYSYFKSILGRCTCLIQHFFTNSIWKMSSFKEWKSSIHF